MTNKTMNLIEEVCRIVESLDERDAKLIMRLVQERADALQMVADLFDENDVLVGLLWQSGVTVRMVHLNRHSGVRTIH